MNHNCDDTCRNCYTEKTVSRGHLSVSAWAWDDRYQHRSISKRTSEIHHNSEKWTSSVNPFPSFTLALFFSHLSHLVIFGQPAHLSLYVSHSPFNGSCISPGVVSTFILASNHVSETQLCLPMDASGDGSKTCQSPWWQALWSACWYLLTFGVVTEHRNLTLTFNLN